MVKVGEGGGGTIEYGTLSEKKKLSFFWGSSNLISKFTHNEFFKLSVFSPLKRFR